ncbi:MAG: hypothetical protein VX278_19260 [Myxococcota bacterium]|nr:hypothetical protein [Myxococcota bacterium]
MEQSPSSMRPSNSHHKRYIISPISDGIFFIFSPILALVIGIGISGTPFADQEFQIGNSTESLSEFLIGIFIMGHLFAVFFRSHGNSKIFSLYPKRFLLVPILLMVAMLSSPWIALSLSLLATWWDVYHSSLQTFGLGRIYDMKSGNNGNIGRKEDWLLNLLLYVGPVIGGVCFIDHLDDFYGYAEVDAEFITRIPDIALQYHGVLRWGLLIFGSCFLLYYLFRYLQYHRQGYRFSTQKILLLSSTGFCSIYTWGFNTFYEAFFIMNFFHALQYFALMWWTERQNIRKRFYLPEGKVGSVLALASFLSICTLYGLWTSYVDLSNSFYYSLTIVISLLHFWFDGFIWSVRKKAV